MRWKVSSQVPLIVTITVDFLETSTKNPVLLFDNVITDFILNILSCDNSEQLQMSMTKERGKGIFLGIHE